MKVASALPLIVITTLGASLPAFAQDDSLLPTFYGKLNVTAALDEPEQGNASGGLESHASRIGLKGDYALSSTLNLIYQAEYQVNPGDEKFAHFNLTQRNSFVGLEGGFGTLLVGRNDTPSKLLQNGIDLFNDLNGDIKFLFLSEIRPNDVVQYTSPTKNGFTASYEAIIDGQKTIGDRATKHSSASVTYGQGAFLFGVAIDHSVVNVDSVRFMSRYREGNLQLGLMYESAKTSRGDKNGVFVSAAYEIDKLVLKAQTGAADQRFEGATQSTVGFDYNLDPESRVFALVTHTGADNRAVINDHFDIGFEHNF